MPGRSERFFSGIRWRLRKCVVLSVIASGIAHASATSRELATLTLEQLADIEITSVSKTAEPLGQAAAPIFVITRDDILRSGARSVPEMLRLAPNLHVAQTSSSAYAITARGLNGNPQLQNFANKLLVLIDGRSVYSPLFSGVYWDMQDVLPDDIERIEVISGPGATLWGANAVNGVINIITRSADQSQGGVVDVGGGNLERGGSMRYGAVSNDVAYRVYAKSASYEPSMSASGDENDDEWSRAQAGFRINWAAGADRFNLQGDMSNGTEAQPTPGNTETSGVNLLARWQRSLAGGGALQVQTYIDRMGRWNTGDNSGFDVETYDLEVQHELPVLAANEIIWGAGYRIARYAIDPQITPVTSLRFVPRSDSLQLSNIFIEDTLTINRQLKLALGVKLEKASDADLATMPNVRLAWNPSASTTIWSSASKAARTATPFDRDVVETLGGVLFLTGDKNFKNEEVTVYQIGYRTQAIRNMSLSITVFKNVFDNLRSIEFSPGGLPLHWDNRMEGSAVGADIWASYQVLPTWRLSAGWSGLRKNLRYEHGSSELGGLAQAGNDPSSRVLLRSSVDISPTTTFDMTLRGVRELPDPQVSGYVDLSARLGWRVSPSWSIALTGENLLRSRHQEFTDGSYVRRGVFAETEWRF